METLCGKEVADEKKKNAHERMCRKCQGTFDTTKPPKTETIPAEAKETHPLNVGGKVIWR